jgi:hypothetical protein
MLTEEEEDLRVNGETFLNVEMSFKAANPFRKYE